MKLGNSALSSTARRGAVIALLLAVGGFSYFFAGAGEGERAPAQPKQYALAAATPMPAPAPLDTLPPPNAAPSVPQAKAQTPAATDHAALMDDLRQSFTREPLETLQAARALEAELAHGPEAAEYQWIIVRSLVNLGHFHEARDEARTLVQRFPDSDWAIDAQRHLLVNPLDLPPREELSRAEIP